MQINPRYVAAVLSLSAAGITGIAMHEGTVYRVYLDPVGIPTSCTGHTSTVTKADVGKPVSKSTCEYLLRKDASSAERAVKHCVTAPVTQEQYDSLTSLAFNIGETNFCRSTLVRKHNAGDCEGAYKEFYRWRYANGVVLPGLVVRRGDEARDYRTGCAETL